MPGKILVKFSRWGLSRFSRQKKGHVSKRPVRASIAIYGLVILDYALLRPNIKWENSRDISAWVLLCIPLITEIKNDREGEAESRGKLEGRGQCKRSKVKGHS